MGNMPFPDRFAAAAERWIYGGGVSVSLRVSGTAAGRMAAKHMAWSRCCSTPRREIGRRASAASLRLPGKEAEFRAAMHTALEYAQTLSCPRVHVMAGRAAGGVERAAMRRTFMANLAWAAELAAPAGIELLIEPINTTGYARIFSEPAG